MSGLKYVIQRAMHMDYKAMLTKINNVHKKTKKSRIAIFNDMRKCAVLYGAGYMDYDLYEMYNLTDEQRNTYITRGRNDDLVKKYNNKEYNHLFENKDEFNTLFNKYIKREWIKADANKEDVLKFIESHDIFMAKPIDGTCGKGIEKIKTNEFENSEAVYNYVINKNYELEELIIQCDELSSIYPGAINTLRVVTILKDGVANVVCTYFRIGNGKYVDNFNSGGMVVPVDEVNGIVKDYAIDKNKILYESHPQTGTMIKGFKFPMWQEALQMCKEAALVVPEVGYVGWDVGFSTKGPLLVEANSYPGHDIYQLPEHTHDKQGVWPMFNRFE